MKLPNAENAVIDTRKLTDYCLDPESPRWRHKARVFESALGFTLDNAEELKQAILDAIVHGEAVIGELDFYGQRYRVDCRIVNEIGSAVVRTGWIVRPGEDFPRLTTCFVLKERQER